ncbi:MAG: bifunctional folylpolyglutamate synthase/dihydrofolate synthase [Synechococcus sp.]|nr:bifunctional folylpolyglutamate synthase/dihydrofolate synthase [Synechococcus sp.]
MQLPDPVELGDLLEPFSRRGIDLGLDRLHQALAAGGHPEQRFPAVQVAGTNGKGSICTALGAILQAAGLKAGLYRSPHLISWCERIAIGDQWIAAEQLRSLLQRWQPLGQQHQLTPFELLTAAAMDHFAAAQVDLAVLEVGLGGRLDATTCHPNRPVLGIANIGLDHREHLGSTLEAIATEKAGIFHTGSVAFSAPQPDSVAQVLEQQAQQRGCQLHWVESLAAEVPLGLAGSWQRSNAAVALAMAQELARQGWPISDQAMAQGLAQAQWSGRLQRRQWRGQPVLIDGAHNPPAAEGLRRELNQLAPGQPRHWLLGIQRHKDGPAIVRALMAPGDRAWMVPIEGCRSWQAAELTIPGVHDSPSAEQALEQLWPAACEPVIAGSLYLLGQLWPTLEPPAEG